MTPAMLVPWPPIHLVALCTVEHKYELTRRLLWDTPPTDNVRTMVNGPDQETTHAEGVVDDERNAIVVSYLGKALKVRHDVTGVANALDIERLGPLVDKSREVLRVARGDELDLDVELLQED